jgi:hypothetical protein
MSGAIPPFPDTPSLRGASLSKGYFFMTWYLVKHRDKFTFTFTFAIIRLVTRGWCQTSYDVLQRHQKKLNNENERLAQ